MHCTISVDGLPEVPRAADIRSCSKDKQQRQALGTIVCLLTARIACFSLLLFKAAEAGIQMSHQGAHNPMLEVNMQPLNIALSLVLSHQHRQASELHLRYLPFAVATVIFLCLVLKPAAKGYRFYQCMTMMQHKGGGGIT
jgi:hypothetical protein